MYPALCTGCERYVYEDSSSEPCPHCFPGLEPDPLRAMEAIMADYFAFQAVACTTQADCTCGRH